jgi:hypothetical protein
MAIMGLDGYFLMWMGKKLMFLEDEDLISSETNYEILFTGFNYFSVINVSP